MRGDGESALLPDPGNGRASSAALHFARRGIQTGRAQGVHLQRLSNSPGRAAQAAGLGCLLLTWREQWGMNPAQRAVLSWASRWEARLPLMVRVSNGSRAKSFNLQGDRSETAHDDRLFFDLPGPRFRRWERRSSACGGGLSLTTRAWRGAHLIPPRGHPAASNQITTGSPVGWQA